MKTYPLFKVHIPVDEALANIKIVLESGFINEGVQVTEFSNAISTFLQAPNLVVLNSCTSALTLALRLVGIGPGDEVISTPMTCVATNTPIANTGAKIVWADVNPETGMIDPVDVANRITSKTRAVMAVAWAGTPPDLARLSHICNANNVALILDAAHAFNARYKGKPIHEFARFTCYSFQAIKHVTTGDGGALVCNSSEDFHKAKCLKWFGLDRDRAKDEKGNWKGQQWDADIEEAGYKFNMNNIAAAIGLAQLKHIHRILSRHLENAMLYNALFARNENVTYARVPENTAASYWVYPMRVVNCDRDELIAKLNVEGIMAGLVHVPNDDYTAFQSSRTQLPGVRSFSRTQFNLPCGWWLTLQNIDYIAMRVKACAKDCAR